jgi:RimJ/RimL family protein N-acetyltransferase
MENRFMQERTQEKELLRLHVEAVWDVRIPAITGNDNEILLLPEGQKPSWSVYVADVTRERIYIWRPDIDDTARLALLERVDEALGPPVEGVATPGISREVALHPIARPTLDIEAASQIARPLTERDRALIEEFEPQSAEYYLDARRAPLFGVIADGRLVSIAHSSRRTEQACELGVETHPDARRRGYGLAVTVLWAAAVAQEGLIAFYSALAENTASLRLAHAAGYRVFARGATIEAPRVL